MNLFFYKFQQECSDEALEAFKFEKTINPHSLQVQGALLFLTLAGVIWPDADGNYIVVPEELEKFAPIKVTEEFIKTFKGYNEFKSLKLA